MSYYKYKQPTANNTCWFLCVDIKTRECVAKTKIIAIRDASGMHWNINGYKSQIVMEGQESILSHRTPAELWMDLQ